MAIAETIITALLALGATEVICGVISIAEYIHNNLIFRKQPETVENRHNPEYCLHDTDKEYIAASKEILHEELGENPTETLLKTDDAEERISAIKALTLRLAEAYRLEDIKIEFGCIEDLSVCGYYSRDENKIFLNCVHLITTNAELTTEFLDTIFHELRHAVQYKMIESEEYVWCNDKKSVKQIADNLIPEHYISYGENMRAYRNQYVEIDAREIAMYILEG